MNAQPVPHPSAEQLSGFGLGKLNKNAAQAIAQHLAACPACRTVVERMPGDTLVSVVRTAKVPPAGSKPSPQASLPGLDGATVSYAPTELPPELVRHSKYRIVRELGRGGMGVVYQAEHIQMERTVAIKVIGKSLLEHPQALERFRQEVKAAAKLSHHNIVAAYDFEKAGDLHMLVMEFVEGQNLADVLKTKGPLPILNACHYLRQAALGLQHAHEKGMVHRDLKPQNLMLTPKGIVKILDLGLARVVSNVTHVEGITGAGATIGTPEYIAPEQALDAAKADIRADIYSLGCTLYCLLSGRPPFTEGTAMQIVLAHMKKAAKPLHEVRSEVPRSLSTVVARMMAKDPAKRYQKPIEIVQALAPFCQKTTGAGKPGESIMPPPMPLVGGNSAFNFREPSKGQTKGKTILGRQSPARRSWPFVKVGLLLVALGLVGWLLAATVFKVKVKTDDGEAFVVLDIDQPGAEVFVDGETIRVVVPGNNKPFEIKVEPGKHKLRISKDGFEVVTQDIEVKTGKSDVVKVRLEPVKGVVSSAKTGPVAMDRKPSTVIGGDWRVEGRELVQTDTKAPAHLFFGDKSWTDYDLSLEIKTVGGTEGSKIYFRASDPSNYYCFAIGSYAGGWNETFRTEKGKWIRDLPPLQQKFALDRWYDVRVEVRGQQIRCFLDGKKLFEYSDAHFPKGQIGLSSWRSSVRWKNMKVTAPDNTVLWDGLPELFGVASSTAEPAQLEERARKLADAVPDSPTDSGERKVAEWVLSEGGSVAVRVNGQEKVLVAGGKLPAEAFALERIDLSGKAVKPADLARLDGLTNLRSLALNNAGVTSAGLANLKSLGNLSFLGLAGNRGVTDGGLEHLRGMAKLDFLDLNATGATDAGMPHLRELRNLANLNLLGTLVTHAGLAQLADTNIRSINLSYTSAGDLELAALKTWPKLDEIVFVRTKVSNAGMIHLKGLSGLRRLWLNDTTIDDEGLKHLAGLTGLTHLYLDNTRVSNAGVDQLLKLKNLNELGIKSTLISAQGFARLKQAFPDAELVWSRKP